MKRERKRERDVSASTPSSVDDDGVDAETSLSLFLSLFMSISLLRLFSRAHYWVNKYILKMRVSSKELFLTLKNFTDNTNSSFLYCIMYELEVCQNRPPAL